MRGWRPLILGVLLLAGCEVDSYFDPSKTGRFEYTPTTIPILERIDVIEREQDPFADATGVTQDDLMPGDLTYRIAPGDFLTVEVFELLVQQQIWTSTRRVNATGYFRLPAPIGDVYAAGLTAQEFQDVLTRLVDERVMPDPMVNVTIEEGAGFTYTVYGAVAGTGLYSLRRADFRILDALAQAGGVPLGTTNVYVIRQVPLTTEATMLPGPSETTRPTRRPGEPPVSIEELIRQLDEPPTGTPAPDTVPPVTPPDSETPPEQPPIDIEDLLRRLEEEDEPDGNVEVMPGFFAQESGPPIDIDDLEPVPVPPAPAPEVEPPPSQPESTPTATRPPGPTGPRETFIYDQQRDEWIPVIRPDAETAPSTEPPPDQQRLFVERIIRIPFQSLKRGESQYNIVIRPNDRIYVAEPTQGVIYIDGEILRPGVYNFPVSGRITLSRLVAAAGGPGPLAMPTRVDLTRMVGTSREATIRLNLGAIRNRTEPDIYLKPDDHIIIGTSWIATPLAVFRNGLRITYGFGFLLDRNFGNDVFGPPPVNRVN